MCKHQRMTYTEKLKAAGYTPHKIAELTGWNETKAWRIFNQRITAPNPDDIRTVFIVTNGAVDANDYYGIVPEHTPAA